MEDWTQISRRLRENLAAAALGLLSGVVVALLGAWLLDSWGVFRRVGHGWLAIVSAWCLAAALIPRR